MPSIKRLLLLLLFVCLLPISGNALTVEETQAQQQEADPYEEYLAIIAEAELPSDFIT